MPRKWTPEQRAAQAEFCRSIKRREVFYEHDGKRMNISGWCKHLGIAMTTFYERRASGWPIEKILTTGKMSPEEIGRNSRRPRYDPNMRTKNDERYPNGEKTCSGCGETKPLNKFNIFLHSISHILTRSSRCKGCASKSHDARRNGYEKDRHRNKVLRYGEPEKKPNGNYIRTDHLEPYLRKQWNPYITIPDHAGRWFEPVAVYPGEVAGTGEVLGRAA